MSDLDLSILAKMSTTEPARDWVSAALLAAAIAVTISLFIGLRCFS
jgi:hypothetical protein